VFGSWLLTNAAVGFYFAQLDIEMMTNEYPSPILLERWSSDGAKQLFTLYFGWIYGLLYALPYLLIYFISNQLRKKGKR
jgi:hypothetical protein